ncbi:hypothetical protein FJ949_19295 [Mesorhizobium sp. B2-4-1]|nr:hypothetical protein FJ426_14595 [Mesorhizobium sp. B2-6-4]TPL63178.1 hypothetical protein FJ949_19295 [Mesorhizobium sp. B2-4-1]TPM95901.1 hypothetical protein FJ966_14825 [Mesorhizobium sp. B2-1-5]
MNWHFYRSSSLLTIASAAREEADGRLWEAEMPRAETRIHHPSSVRLPWSVPKTTVAALKTWQLSVSRGRAIADLSPELLRDIRVHAIDLPDHGADPTPVARADPIAPHRRGLASTRPPPRAGGPFDRRHFRNPRRRDHRAARKLRTNRQHLGRVPCPTISALLRARQHLPTSPVRSRARQGCARPTDQSSPSKSFLPLSH